MSTPLVDTLLDGVQGGTLSLDIVYSFFLVSG